jgi:fructose-1-phosphate kinase PfkB-like protein
MAKILVVGLNPAWQTVLGFGDFRLGEVNRAQSATTLASGKGFNTGRVLRRLGHEVTLLQILGGGNGRLCLADCEALGMRSLHAWVEMETRACITLLHRERQGRDQDASPSGLADPSGSSPGEATEIIAPFCVPETGVGRRLLELLPSHTDAFDAVAICGTVPPGVEAGIYDALLSRFPSAVSVVDAWQGLDAGSIAKAGCVKLNRMEYGKLQAAFGDEAIAPALFLVTSGGGEASVLRGGASLARISPPLLPVVVNPIGAGDTVTAAVVHHLLAGQGPVEAFRRALALGSASCLHRLPAEYRDEDAEGLLPFSRVVS